MFEIYFSDLNDDAQKRFLEYMGLSDPRDGNYDIDMCPIVIVDYNGGLDA